MIITKYITLANYILYDDEGSFETNRFQNNSNAVRAR